MLRWQIELMDKVLSDDERKNYVDCFFRKKLTAIVASCTWSLQTAAVIRLRTSYLVMGPYWMEKLHRMSRVSTIEMALSIGKYYNIIVFPMWTKTNFARVIFFGLLHVTRVANPIIFSNISSSIRAQSALKCDSCILQNVLRVRN